MDPIYAFLTDLLQPAMFEILILVTALMYPRIFYASHTTRRLTYLLICFTSLTTFTHKYEYQHNISSYVVGMAAVWAAILSFSLLVIHNPPEEFKRIRRGKGERYEWEPYPQDSIVRKITWIGDLTLNFRAVGWSHRVPRYPIPEDVRRLYDEAGVVTTGATSYDKVQEKKAGVLGVYGFWFLRSYLLVDLIIWIIDPDPFFRGDIDPVTLPFFSFPPLRVLVPLYRVVTAMAGIYAVLDLLCVSHAIVWGLLGQRWAGTWSEVWMNPPLWGPLSGIWHKGLKGFWASFWHDLFAFGFLSTATYLVRLPTATTPQLQPRSNTLSFRRLVHVFTIFSLSGLLHAGGSYLQPASTSPLCTLAGFQLQCVGIYYQITLSKILQQMGLQNETCRKALIFCFGVWWACLTAPSALDDMALGQLFTLRPLPVSIVQLALGKSWMHLIW